MNGQSKKLNKSMRSGLGKDSGTSNVLPAIPNHLDFLFSDRPLLPNEDKEEYEELLRSIVQQIRPSDVIEAIWVKDIIDFVWEAKRIRRWKTQILIQGQMQAIKDLIGPALPATDPMQFNQSTIRSYDVLSQHSNYEGKKDQGQNQPSVPPASGTQAEAWLRVGRRQDPTPPIIPPSADALATGYMAGKTKEQSQVNEILQQRGLTSDNISAQSFHLSLASIERVDRLASLNDRRRDALLREIERKRASFGHIIREAAEDVLQIKRADEH